MSSKKRIVIKLGSQVVAEAAKGPASRRIRSLIAQMAAARQAGHEILLVTSGAVALGRKSLGLTGRLTLAEKQASAAVGQAELMTLYRRWFRSLKVETAQLLLTADDFSNRNRYNCLQNTLQVLLEYAVVPIINENDPVSTAELRPLDSTATSFGDNDRLSALVAAKLDADLLVILTDVDGIFTADPKKNPNATRVSVVSDANQWAQIESAGQSAMGRGGMSSKIEAAKIAAFSGVHAMIASGFGKRPIDDCVSGFLDGPDAWDQSPGGTWVLPRAQGSHNRKKKIPRRKRWIGLSSGYRGILVINAGARSALVSRGASLLPSGIVSLSGSFASKEIVSIQDEQGQEIGRGIINYDSKSLERIRGRRSSEISEILGAKPARPEAVHRDDLALFIDDALSANESDRRR